MGTPPLTRALAVEIVAAVDACNGVVSDAARRLGIGRNAATSRLATAARVYGLKPKPRPPRERPLAPAAVPLGGSDADRRIVALTDEVARLKAALKDAHRAALDDDKVRELLGALAAAPADPPRWLIEAGAKRGKKTPETPVMIFSDWHVGESVAASETHGVNAFTPEIAERRVRRLVENIVKIATRHGPGVYPGAVVNLAGDFISGGIHAELAKTDIEQAIPAALRVRDLLVWALETLAATFGRLYVPCVYGNHGRATQKPEFKREAANNFDWLIYQLLIRHFAGSKMIVIDAPATGDAHYRVYHQRYLLMHGHELGVKGGDGIIGAIGPIMRGEVKVGKQAGAIGRDYDMLLMGHWHQELWLPRAIVANSLKGWDEFAMKALRALPSAPSQPLWFVHPRHGVTSRWNVRVDEPPAAAEEWVSFQRRAA